MTYENIEQALRQSIDDIHDWPTALVKQRDFARRVALAALALTDYPHSAADDLARLDAEAAATLPQTEGDGK